MAFNYDKINAMQAFLQQALDQGLNRTQMLAAAAARTGVPAPVAAVSFTASTTALPAVVATASALKQKLISVGVPSAQLISQKRQRVLLGLVERAITLASTTGKVFKVLFQKRFGRAVHILPQEVADNARLLGIVVALRMESNKNKKVAGPLDRSMSLSSDISVPGPVDRIECSYLEHLRDFPAVSNYFLFYEEEELEITPWEEYYKYPIGPFIPNSLNEKWDEFFSLGECNFLLSHVDEEISLPIKKQDVYAMHSYVPRDITSIAHRPPLGTYKYEKYSEPEDYYYVRCPLLAHQMNSICGFDNGDAFPLEHCFYCALNALQMSAREERKEWERRKSHFDLQFEMVPAPQIKKAGVSINMLQGMVFGAYGGHTRGPHKICSPASHANVHSEREHDELRHDLQERAHDEQDEHGPPTIKNTIATLRMRKKKGRKDKSKVLEYGEGRCGDGGAKILEKDVFSSVRHGSGLEKAMSWLGKNANDGILTQQTWPTRSEDVLRPRNIKNCVYTPLPQFSEDQLRTLLDKKDMKSSGITAIDLAIQSHVAEGTPMMAFCTIMDGDNGDPNLAALSGSKFDLGRDRCQVITLPLVNVNLSYMAKQVNEGNKCRLYLATLLNDTCGIYENVPVFSYGTSQLLEHRPDAYTNQTLCKEDWIDIESRNAKKGIRILKGFNVHEHMARDYDEKLIDFPSDSKLTCKPRDTGSSNFAFSSEGVVKRHPATDRLAKSCSLRFGPQGRQASVFEHVHTEAPIVNNRKLGVEAFTAPRHSFAHSGSEDATDVYEVAYVNKYVVPRDAKAGHVIGSIDLHKHIKQQKLLPFHKIFSMGMVQAVLGIRIFCGGSAFLGTTIGIIQDMFNHLDVDNDFGGTIPNAVMNSCPLILHPMSLGGFGEYFFNTGETMGHNYFPLQKSFADPRLHLCIYDDNDATAAADWTLTIHILMKGVKPTVKLEVVPMLSIPYVLPEYIKLDLWKGLGKIPLGGTNRASLASLAFAHRHEYAPRCYTLGATQAMYGILQGVGGVLHGRLVRTSTSMVTCNVRVFIWGQDTDPTILDVAQYPHQDINFEKDDGTFNLHIQSAFSKISTKVTQATLWVWPMGGPLAPSGVVSPFTFAIYIDGITPHQQVSALVKPDVKYAWCALSNFPKGNFALDLPAFVVDIQFKTCFVELMTNPLSNIFATCGFFSGKLTMFFDWSFGEAMTVGATTLNIQLCYGTTMHSEVVQQYTTNVYMAGSTSFDVNTGDFSGFCMPGGTSHDRFFFKLGGSHGSYISKILVSVKLDPGFSFYGRGVNLVKSIAPTPTRPGPSSKLIMDKGS